MTSSVHYTVLIEYNWLCIHSVSSRLTFDLCMWTWENSPSLVKKALCVVVSPDLMVWTRITFPALMSPTSQHVCGCCFQVAFLERPQLGTSEASPSNAQGIGVWRNCRHCMECCGSCHLLPFTAVLWLAVWDTNCWHCCTPPLGRWAGEGVYNEHSSCYSNWTQL